MRTLRDAVCADERRRRFAPSASDAHERLLLDELRAILARRRGEQPEVSLEEIARRWSDLGPVPPGTFDDLLVQLGDVRRSR